MLFYEHGILLKYILLYNYTNFYSKKYLVTLDRHICVFSLSLFLSLLVDR